MKLSIHLSKKTDSYNAFVTDQKLCWICEHSDRKRVAFLTGLSRDYRARLELSHEGVHLWKDHGIGFECDCRHDGDRVDGGPCSLGKCTTRATNSKPASHRSRFALHDLPAP